MNSNNVKSKKRFIAGASCPSCKAQDTLRWWIENNIELVECVECDYQEQRKPKSVESSEHGSDQMIGIFKPE
ncbi:YheV family putative metal-binding protein [Vibrio fluvialis]|nr:YheV family putative metal-binding protein [Vibrio fluvialis]